jgi:hypothetical protein
VVDVERIVGAVNKITAGKPNPGADADAVGHQAASASRDKNRRCCFLVVP